MKEAIILSYHHIGLLIVMNILFCLASLPLLTLPVTIPMLSAGIAAIARGERPSWKAQWKRAGRYYLHGGLLLLCIIGVTMVLAADLHVLWMMKQTHPVTAFLMFGFILCFLLIWLLMQIYLWPLFLAEHLTVIRTLKKAFLLVLGNFGLSIAVGLTILGFVLVMMVSGVGPFVIMVAFVFLLQHLLFNNLMEKYDEQR
jgi:uncharacterized membrane protein YesL